MLQRLLLWMEGVKSKSEKENRKLGHRERNNKLPDCKSAEFTSCRPARRNCLSSNNCNLPHDSSQGLWGPANIYLGKQSKSNNRSSKAASIHDASFVQADWSVSWWGWNFFKPSVNTNTCRVHHLAKPGCSVQCSLCAHTCSRAWSRSHCVSRHLSPGSNAGCIP